MGKESNDTVQYHARLDKTPEPRVFEHLDIEDKRALCNLRTAGSGYRSKLASLRDEIDEKEKQLDQERTIRKKLEEKLNNSSLRDVYNSEEVNEELRQRLPRANKNLKFSLEMDDVDLNTRPSSLSPDSYMRDVEEHIRKVQTRTEQAVASKRDAGASKKLYNQTYDDFNHSEDERSQNEQRSKHDNQHRGQGNYPAFYPPAPGFLPMYNYATAPMATPTYYMPAPAPAYPMMAGHMPPQMAGGPGPFAASTPTKGSSGPAMTVGPATSTPDHKAYATLSDTGYYSAVSPDSVTPVHTSGYGGAGTEENGIASVNSLEKGRAKNMSATVRGEANASTVNSANMMYAGIDHNKQISLLLQEIDKLKSQNKKLADQLAEAEKDFANIKLATETRDLEAESKIAAKVAAVIEEIYRAQKERDAAIMNRLRVANEERDAAIDRMKKLEKDGRDSDFDITEHIYEPDEMNVAGLLKKIDDCDNFRDVDRFGEVVSTKINHTRHRKKHITAEEMKVILEERDSAILKCKRQEQELMRYQSQGQQYNPNPVQDQNLRAKLSAITQERDMAVAKIQRLEDEIQNLRVYYSLNKSLSQDANRRDQYNNTIEGLKMRAQKENNGLLAQLKSVTSEKNELAEDLAKAQMLKEEAEAKKENLEKLVKVLRRKLHGMSNVTVLE
ncbi:uncharacterized protein LOC141904065 isoform X2 [Tubulanus polymorphus]|uniref:uncharacterized protein LOC141904065 isoform X2 n=1 Tax=Tubulanus polymorphus TaxID=672921 RepID=UPI003DA68413